MASATDRVEKVVREDEKVHSYAKGEKVTLSESEAKKLEASGHVVPLGGWTDEKDQGETKTDNEVGAGYGPLAAEKNKSKVLGSRNVAEEAQTSGSSSSSSSSGGGQS